MAQGIHDWPVYLRQVHDALTPGGVAQFIEARLMTYSDDDTLPKGGVLDKYFENLHSALEIAGITDVNDELKGMLEDAGFVDVVVEIHKVPVGSWPREKRQKEIGKWGMIILSEGFHSYGQALFTRLKGMKPEEAKELCQGAYDELRNRAVHSYFPV